jgi:BirA family biotin operon repressor/biotin-[acetyl-CoA-carboxylase] ligase
MSLINKYQIAEFKLLEFDKLENTMGEVKKYDKNTVVFTTYQEKAKGKGDRKWETYRGNLYFSMLLKTKNKTKDYSQLSFLSSVAIRESVIQLANKDIDIQCKWPNDVLINKKKFCGILLEFDMQKQELIIGIGVNIKYFPYNTLYQATSIHNEELKNIAPLNLTKQFLFNFSNLYKIWNTEGFEKIKNLWLKNTYKFKEKIKVNCGNKKYTGIFKDLDKDGTLILEPKDDKIIYIKSGDVF